MNRSILTEAEIQKITATIAAAERSTLGEIVPVIVRSSDGYPAARWRCAIFCSLVASFVLYLALPHVDPLWILCAQFVVIGIGLWLGNWSPLKKIFLTDYNIGEEVYQRAQQAFLDHNIHQTAGHTGILIFISLFEHRALILADSGIHAKVGKEKWNVILEKLLLGIRAGKLSDALCQTIQDCGTLLTQHFPGSADNDNELADKVFIED